MKSQSHDEVIELVNLLNSVRPLTKGQIKALYESHLAEQHVNYFAPPAEVAKKIALIEQRAISNQKSKAHYLWLESLLPQNANALSVHAKLLIEFFQAYTKTGEVPAPASAWRIAVTLSKEKQKDLELAFLQAWSRHFGKTSGKTLGTMYEKIQNRLDNLKD